MSIFNLPDLGEGLPDAEIHEWHVKEGDEVKVDQLLVSMETAKAVVEVPAPQSGTIKKLYGAPGDVINTGDPLVEFASAEASQTAEESAPSAEAKHLGATVAGAIEVGDTVITESAAGVTPTQSNAPAVKVLPAIRALAKKLNVDLNSLTGTGPNGQITQEDVKNASTDSTATANKMEPLRGVRRTMATIMAQSHSEVVPVTIVDDADLYHWTGKQNITTRVLRAIVSACRAEPALNTHFHSDDMNREVMSDINIGVAMDSENGLFVPVIKQAQEKSQQALRDAIDSFKQQVGNRSIAPEDLKGATISLSNFGVFAGRYANPIVVPPCVAIIGTGKIRQQLVGHDNVVKNHNIMPLSVSIDHRAVTGGEASRFLAAMIDDLQKPE